VFVQNNNSKLSIFSYSPGLIDDSMLQISRILNYSQYKEHTTVLFQADNFIDF